MSKHIQIFKGWAETLRQDADAMKALVESADADEEARKLAAASLSYLVTRMDLVPDWSEGIGALDDVMVLRVCAALVSGHALGSLPSSAEIDLGRMGNDVEKIYDFLGGELLGKLKSYCVKLTESTVRGRTPGVILTDDAARAALYADVEEEIKRSGVVVIADADDAELKLKAYLTHKLG
ncbi:MAG: DUF1232 domain-containing protein [Kofleriaceae bacterium]|nr:DUF1232 domain-containing protein [Myxococcales bacterium]MCB9572142.1 DUF1232 domain-containing protein [Kofleriaceae bacterium]